MMANATTKPTSPRSVRGRTALGRSDRAAREQSSVGYPDRFQSWPIPFLRRAHAPEQPAARIQEQGSWRQRAQSRRQARPGLKRFVGSIEKPVRVFCRFYNAPCRFWLTRARYLLVDDGALGKRRRKSEIRHPVGRPCVISLRFLFTMASSTAHRTNANPAWVFRKGFLISPQAR